MSDERSRVPRLPHAPPPQVKKLPHIELYAGKRGRLESFVCGPSKAGMLGEKLDRLLADPTDPSVGASIPGPSGSDEVVKESASDDDPGAGGL